MKLIHKAPFACVALLATTVGSFAADAQDPAPIALRAPEPGPLDADGNGLYDDTERKQLLDVLHHAFPELPGPFDADGDGKVTVLEQSAGRHPLSKLIPKTKQASDLNIPWAIDIFPEWLTTAYFQEDVVVGPVSTHEPRGTLPTPASQTNEALLPKKSAERGGIEFAANSGQHFTAAGQKDARWNYRWGMLTFRIDAASASGNETILLDLNRNPGSNDSYARIWHDKTTGLNIQYVGKNKGGRDRRVLSTQNIVTDGQGWNVVVFGIRYGQLFASVNGEVLTSATPQLPRFGVEQLNNRVTFVGDRATTNAAWAYDTLVFGLTEPSEAMVRKMSGWAAHRLGFQDRLPAGHPYASARPILDLEDLPTRYLHDEEKWTAWGKSLTKDVTRVNAGGPRVHPSGFQRVFHDDFRAYRIKDSTSGEGDLWMGVGFNTAVGASIPLVTPGRKPDAYPHNAATQQQTLSLVKQGNRWFGSAFYSINDLGHGYTWKGPKIFRVRWMFPKEDPKNMAGGLFPAFWSYDPDFLFWRTDNRIEVDWLEFDGMSGHYLNGLSTHFHYSHFRKNIFAKNPGSYKRYKGYGGELIEAKSKIPGGIFIWDGQFHTWEFIVEEDTTYINVTIPDKDGSERWVEVYRLPTSPVYLERLDIQLDYALKAKHGMPKKDRQDVVVDWIDVFQKTAAVEAVPVPFTSRPKLSGSNQAGETITCEPNLDGITDVRYYWFADDYPLTWGPSPSYTLTAAEAGKPIRCMVKAVGARDMPEAWSNTIR